MAEWFRASNSSSGGSDHWSVGSNPSHDTCALEQDTLLQLLLFIQGYKWVPARVEVDTVFEKAFGTPQQLRLYAPKELRKIKGKLLAE